MRHPLSTTTSNRRTFLRQLAFGGTGLCLGTPALGAADSAPRFPICAFTKPLQQLSFDELADRMADLGFNGIEAPVRPGGHIEPKNVEDELPQLVEALANRGLKIHVMASGINGLDSPHTETVLRTASQLGVKRYRLAYYQYDLNRPVVKQIREFRAKLRDLSAFSSELGISPIYQNHSGSSLVGAAVWDVYELLRDLPAGQAGMAFDLGHATIEGGQCWPIHVNLMRPYFRALYVKDFVWQGSRVKWTPLGTGRTDPKFYQDLARQGFRGPLSIHVEYLEHGDLPKYLAAFKNDLQQLNQWLGQ